ncbi:Aste57867_8941 [Aphanomyces stellatus]|uniref:Aste57867_8941 protein n=1 Tax=Aphanomyces stellatus TaxID=120398 RepID=A0A485KLR7_9STRA|nr:hypothetical protein As57867_008906 [Aphanomyces stellatus]VFT85825.1 Aste57867_8941 [Aphanomyces stellatus]
MNLSYIAPATSFDTPASPSASSVASFTSTKKATDDKRRKRVLTAEQLLTNRLRSKEYYEAHKDKVLQKLRNHYSENREKERQRQREKYRRAKAKKQPVASLDAKYALQVSTSHQPTVVAPVSDQRLQIHFLLN